MMGMMRRRTRPPPPYRQDTPDPHPDLMPCRSASCRSACNGHQRRRPHGSPLPARRQGGPAPPWRLRPHCHDGAPPGHGPGGPTGDPCLASAPSDDGDPGGIPPRPADAPDGRLPAAGAMPGATHRPVPAVPLTCRLSAPGAGSPGRSRTAGTAAQPSGPDGDAMMAAHHPRWTLWGWARAPGGRVRPTP